MSILRAATETTNLGRYHVVKRLAAGGMADVLLARTDGIEGFARHVVIKRIHADLLEEERYVKMFLDEARLAASLHHQNIVQVNDIGIDNGEYFFAMEYVHGHDARDVLVKSSKRGALIPLEHVITIVTSAAAGLHHAHEQCKPDRTPLDIVHRDVSPANILIGFDGGVKVADFGIALAAHRAEQTQSGVLKGKVAYMSPEQCNCERVDRRSDVFSLGIVLYELCTVHPCFAGQNDFLTMSAIVAGDVRPPSMLNARVTPALEAIILKALAKAPEDRYQTADELRVALERFASEAGLRSSTTALADYMKQEMGERPLPWLEDKEPDVEIAEDEEVSEDFEISVVDTAARTDEVSAAPVDQSPSRRIKATLPLRTVRRSPPANDVTPVVVAPPPEPLAEVHEVDEVDEVDEVHEMHEVPSPPAEVGEHTALVRTALAWRRWWLAVAIIAVIASGASFVIARLEAPTTPAADSAPKGAKTRAPYVTPLPAPHFTPSP